MSSIVYRLSLLHFTNRPRNGLPNCLYIRSLWADDNCFSTAELRGTVDYYEIRA